MMINFDFMFSLLTYLLFLSVDNSLMSSSFSLYIGSSMLSIIALFYKKRYAPTYHKTQKNLR